MSEPWFQPSLWKREIEQLASSSAGLEAEEEEEEEEEEDDDDDDDEAGRSAPLTPQSLVPEPLVS